MIVEVAINWMFKFFDVISHLPGFVLSMTLAWGSVQVLVFIREGLASRSPPLLPHVFTRDSTVYIQNSYGCHHQSDQGLASEEEEKVPGVLNPYDLLLVTLLGLGHSGKWWASSGSCFLSLNRKMIAAQIPQRGL